MDGVSTAISKQTIFSTLWENINNLDSMISIATVLLILLSFLLLTQVFKVNIWEVLGEISAFIFRISGKLIKRKEIKYHRDKTIGKFNDKRKKAVFYNVVNDLIIDLGLKHKGATPYTFLFLLWFFAFLFSILIGELLFSSLVLGILLTPIMFAFIFCTSYTRANIVHDTRIESIIEAENIISNNIREGIVVAVRNNIDMFPRNIRQEYEDFLENVTQRNYHIKTALEELGNNLGSASDDFIKKCIVFELEEEHGIAGMFQDIVEVNNIKMEMRTEMKRKFEEVTTQFITGASMIVVFLVGVIALYDVVANFYLHNLIGQLILALDFLIFVLEFVFITYLRAKEL